MKSSTADGRICFRCKKPGHLKKDCPEQPYCSKCRTRGHIPVKCPLKKQHRQQSDKRHKSVNHEMDERCKNQREDWKRAQDQPQYSHLDNRCLNCAGNHSTCDCPMRQQHQTPPANNPVGSTGTNYLYPPHFQQPSPLQHSQQSQPINCWIIYTHIDGQQPTISTRSSKSTPKTINSTCTTPGYPTSKTSYTLNI